MTAIPHAIGSHKHTHTETAKWVRRMWRLLHHDVQYINNLMYCICNLINEPAKYTASSSGEVGGVFSAWAKDLINI